MGGYNSICYMLLKERVQLFHGSYAQAFDKEVKRNNFKKSTATNGISVEISVSLGSPRKANF